MKKPIILAVDDDLQVLRAIRQDLRSQYKNDYKILSTDNAQEALDIKKQRGRSGLIFKRPKNAYYARGRLSRASHAYLSKS
jgi:CheY-like chemotaxis protein